MPRMTQHEKLSRRRSVSPPTYKPLSPEESIAAFYNSGDTPTIDELKDRYIAGKIDEKEFEIAVEQALSTHGLDAASPSTNTQTVKDRSWWITAIGMASALCCGIIAVGLHTFTLPLVDVFILLAILSWCFGVLGTISHEIKRWH